MSSGAYSFIDIAVLEEVRARFAAGDALAILTVDLDSVIWANGAGAALLGYTDLEAAMGASPRLPFATRRQISAAPGFPRMGRDRPVAVRLGGRMVQFLISSITLPDGQPAVLLAVPARTPAELGGERIIAGFGQAGHFAALLDAEGRLSAASQGFGALGITQETLARLVDEVGAEDDRLVKRLVPAEGRLMPAGIARLMDEPALHLLIAVDAPIEQLAGNGAATPDETMEGHAAHLPGRGEEAAEPEAGPATEGADPETSPVAAAELPADGRDPAHTGRPDDAEAMTTLDALEGATAAAAGDDAVGISPHADAPTEAAEAAMPAADARDDATIAAGLTESSDAGLEPAGLAAVAHEAEEPAPSDADLPERLAEDLAAADAPHDDALPHLPQELAAEPDEAPAVVETVASPATGEDAESPLPKPDLASDPIRFSWRTDANGAFSAVSDDFVRAVGPRAADVVGRRFSDVADEFGLDPDGEIAGLLERRDTWSGRSVLWPIAGTDLLAPVDLAALPAYGRDRTFDGFRGFGVARMGDVLVDPAGRGLRLTEQTPADAPAAEEAGEPAAATPAEVTPAADPSRAETPVIPIAGHRPPRSDEKVIRLDERRTPLENQLSTVERNAFEQIRARLSEDYRLAEQEEAATSPDAPPPGEAASSGEAAPSAHEGRQPDIAEAPTPPAGDGTAAAEGPETAEPMDSSVRMGAETDEAAQPVHLPGRSGETADAWEDARDLHAEDAAEPARFYGDAEADEPEQPPYLADEGAEPADAREDAPDLHAEDAAEPAKFYGDADTDEPEQPLRLADEGAEPADAWRHEGRSDTESEDAVRSTRVYDDADAGAEGTDEPAQPLHLADDSDEPADAREDEPDLDAGDSAEPARFYGDAEAGAEADEPQLPLGLAADVGEAAGAQEEEVRLDTEPEDAAEPARFYGDGDAQTPRLASEPSAAAYAPEDGSLPHPEREEAAEAAGREDIARAATGQAPDPAVTDDEAIVSDLEPEAEIDAPEADVSGFVEPEVPQPDAWRPADASAVQAEGLPAEGATEAGVEPGPEADEPAPADSPLRPAETAAEAIPAAASGEEPATRPAGDRGVTSDAPPAPPLPAIAAAGFLPSAFSGEERRIDVDPDLIAGLPLPLLVHAGDRLFFANREFLGLTGYADLEQLAEAGGLDALFADGGADAAAAPEGRKLRLRTARGALFAVDAHLQSIRWRGGAALLLALRRAEIGRSEPAGAAAQGGRDDADPDELERRVAEMRTIIDTATDGVVLIDNDGAIRNISRPAEALFGFDSADVEGEPFASLFATESQRAARDYLAGLSDNGVASVLNDGREVIGREARGRFIPLFMTIGRLPGEGGYCAVVRDITQWKRAEEELTQARSQAERASSQKTEFLARVSHEIRTPLNAIIGFSELMIDEKFGPIDSERYRDYLRDINRSGNHVLDLVNDLLDISKIEAGEQDMHYEAVSLNEALSESVAMMQPQANRERVIIRSSFASRLPEVVADLRSVRQIALNLLSNAIRYTPAGGQVIVSTAYEAAGDVVIRVRDTGIGMTLSEIDQALKPFKQINALKRPRNGGTGLGLPLTKAMVEANRARFAISSTPGEGTLVEITFPSTRVLAE